MLKLDMQEKHWDIIRTILAKYPFTFYAFGSRVKGTAKQYSDFDVCYKENISDAIISQIQEQFEESNLPFKVDIVSWQRCTPEFQKHIVDDLVALPK